MLCGRERGVGVGAPPCEFVHDRRPAAPVGKYWLILQYTRACRGETPRPLVPIASCFWVARQFQRDTPAGGSGRDQRSFINQCAIDADGIWIGSEEKLRIGEVMLLCINPSYLCAYRPTARAKR